MELQYGAGAVEGVGVAGLVVGAPEEGQGALQTAVEFGRDETPDNMVR